MDSASLQIIIFSKERTLQLYSLIRSITDLTDIREEDLTILYQDSVDVPYDVLRKQVACCFVQQSDFLNDLRKIVKGSVASYICFMVDDLIYREEFYWREVFEFMETNTDIDAFSLRLGRNIKDELAPEFNTYQKRFLVWDTGSALGRSWKYFWELMSTVYHRELVIKYLNRCLSSKVTYPNPLEGYYYRYYPSYCGGKFNLLWSFMPDSWRRNRMACFVKSKCFTQGVNMVAARDIDYDNYLTPIELHRLFLDGCKIDYSCLGAIENTKPNAGRKYFRILDANGCFHPASIY